MGTRGYLIQTGYQYLTSDEDFPLSQAHETKWGVNDSLTACRALQLIRQMPSDRPWHLVWQTLSSHEPFDVPYHRLADKRLNAFAYTDHCIGQFVDSLRHMPQWDDMLLVLLPDHGFLYDLTYQDPSFFHSPMLWLGGAVARPRTVDVLMNQSDVAATLLSQLGLPHRDYPWSRNVLSSRYTYPFAYSTYPGGILFADSTGVTVYDIAANEPITERPAPSPERLRRAKAILQTSYDKLGQSN
jgi:phosphoglycerol transferase MdoB-like AlkP superfamily enzyme